MCFRPQVKEADIPTLLGTLERVNVNHWATVTEKLCSLMFFRMPDDGQAQKPSKSERRCFAVLLSNVALIKIKKEILWLKLIKT
jgi:hypothetical protein